MYRTDDGLKCAVGCLITDDAYSPAIEKNGIRSEIVLNSLASSGILVERGSKLYKMLRDLQEMHDVFVISAWPKRLRDIANHYKLDHSVIQSHRI